VCALNVHDLGPLISGKHQGSPLFFRAIALSGLRLAKRRHVVGVNQSFFDQRLDGGPVRRLPRVSTLIGLNPDRFRPEFHRLQDRAPQRIIGARAILP